MTDDMGWPTIYDWREVRLRVEIKTAFIYWAVLHVILILASFTSMKRESNHESQEMLMNFYEL